MKNIAFIAFLACLTVIAASAQSGRRPAAAAQPAAAPTVESPPSYSESSPQKKRPIYRRPAKPKAPAASTADRTVPDAKGEDVVRIESNLITIPVSVFDRNGLYIPGLKKEDFTIFEDGEEQEIEYFGTSEKPFTVMLLLDTSLSTEYKIEEIQAAARAFVDQLKPQDKVIVIEFDGNVHVLTEATNDRAKIYKAIKKADFGYGTSLYDSVEFSFKKRLNQIEGRKAVVLFTDGVDTTSIKAGYDSTLAMVEEADTMVFPVYYNTFDSNQINNADPWFDVRGTRPEDYALGRQYLEDLAAYTGGRIFRPESTPGGLAAAFEGIAEELRRQYNIGYIPKTDSAPGERKNIKVRVNRPNLIVRSRDSYIVGVH